MRIRIRKERTYIAQAGCAEQGVDNSMQCDVGIAVSGQASVVGNVNPAEHQLSAVCQPVNICAYSRSVFYITLVYHNTPFVLGRSVPVILTAAARA